MFSYIKQGCRVKEGLALDKSFRKTFGRKKVNSDKLEFSKNLNKFGIKGVSSIR